MFISVFNVKVGVLHCDWLICEIILAALGYNNNTKRREEEKIYNWKFKIKVIFVGVALHCTIKFQQYKRQRSCKPSKWEGFATTANRTILFVALLRSS